MWLNHDSTQYITHSHSHTHPPPSEVRIPRTLHRLTQLLSWNMTKWCLYFNVNPLPPDSLFLLPSGLKCFDPIVKSSTADMTLSCQLISPTSYILGWRPPSWVIKFTVKSYPILSTMLSVSVAVTQLKLPYVGAREAQHSCGWPFMRFKELFPRSNPPRRG